MRALCNANIKIDVCIPLRPHFGPCGRGLGGADNKRHAAITLFLNRQRIAPFVPDQRECFPVFRRGMQQVVLGEFIIIILPVSCENRRCFAIARNLRIRDIHVHTKLKAVPLWQIKQICCIHVAPIGHGIYRVGVILHIPHAGDSGTFKQTLNGCATKV